MLNTYGLKIDLNSLATASADTVYVPKNRGHRQEIVYDRGTGKVWVRYYVDENSYTICDDPDVMVVCLASDHHSKQWIMDAIKQAVDRKDAQR